MAFPSSPVDGQIYTFAGRTWRWDATAQTWDAINTFMNLTGPTGITGATGAMYNTVRQQFTATAGQTTFTVTGGYIAGQIDVYYNGVKLRNGVEVTVSSGSNIVLATGAALNALIEVVGLGSSNPVNSTSQVLYQQFTASGGQTTFTVTNGYVPSQIDVYLEGVKLVNGTDVNVSDGSTVVLASGAIAGSILEVRGWTTPVVNTQATAAVRQLFTATAGQTTFTVSGGYIPGQVDVYKNGTKLINGTTVNVSNGSTVVLSSGASLNDIIDVVGINYYTAGGSVNTPVRQTFTATASQTTFTVLGGYTPGQIDVYQNGAKLVNGTDVDVSSGSTIVLATGASVGDSVDVVAIGAISMNDVVRKSGDNMSGNLLINNQSVATMGKSIAMAMIFG